MRQCWSRSSSVHENHWTRRTLPMARHKCLMRDFTNLNRIYQAHQINVWWIMKFFQVHCQIYITKWCHQATSHRPSQCGSRSLLACEVTRPQRVKYHLTFRRLPGHCTWDIRRQICQWVRTLRWGWGSQHRGLQLLWWNIWQLVQRHPGDRSQWNISSITDAKKFTSNFNSRDTNLPLNKYQGHLLG